MKRSLIAWTWSTGVIEFGYVLPKGALPIIAGKAVTVRRVIGVMACHGGDDQDKLLVPGVREARTRGEAFNAIVRFCRQVRRQVSFPNRTRITG